MEEEAYPIRKHQRRLNPTILDVVKKEVTKLLVVGIIYPILDSQWVSPVQVVPKKSRMTITKNQHDELDCMGVFMDDFKVYAESGIEVDKAKIDSLPFFLIRLLCGSKLALPLSKLLQKDVDFNFDQPCVEAFQELKT
ncbi:hypothetical protein CR513_41790, partial [Mucuna pruriens]